MGLSRKEATELAVKIIDEQAKVPMKSNGYPADGWKAPSLAEKVDAIVKLAEFMWEPEDVVVDTKSEDKDA